MIDANGKEYSFGPIPLKNAMSIAGDAEVAVTIGLPFKEVFPGKYRLIVESTEATSAETVTLGTDLEFTSPN
jgi:hypothetical protein